MAGGAGGRDLPSTPTWAVALVCAVIVILSLAMEHGLHKLGHVRAPFPVVLGLQQSIRALIDSYACVVYCLLRISAPFPMCVRAVVPHAAEEGHAGGAREDQSR
jgi:hypothetical protein